MWFNMHQRHGAPGGFGGGRFEGRGMRGRGGFGWGGAGDGEGGGRRRRFDGAELRLLLLALLAEAPRHGYDLIREIEERTGGGYAPSPGVVYPTLTMLGEMGLIEEIKEDGARKRFAITEAGQALLAEERATADAVIERLAHIGAREKRGDAAPIRRAMMSLHMALREKLVAAEARADLAHDVAAILDEAARQIERLER